MNTKELRDKIGKSSFNAIIKHPYYKEHLYTSHKEPEYHHETSPSGAYSTVRADVPFGGKKKTITFQYHKNKVHNAHYALNDKHIRSHKEVNESMENIQELSAKLIQSYLNKLKAKKNAEQAKAKKPAPMTYHDDGTPMDVKEEVSDICRQCGSTPCNCTHIDINEAKIGDRVQVTHGSQKGLVGHVGEIRKGLGGKDHTYTIDYTDKGNRQSVQVKKAHTKVIKEVRSEYSKGAHADDQQAFSGTAPKDYSKEPVTRTRISSYKSRDGLVTHEVKQTHGKTYEVTSSTHSSKEAAEKARAILQKKHGISEETITEVSKKVLGRYIEKAATSMSSAAFGQGQASASRRPPSEKDQKTGMKRMTGIARATSKLTKEEAEQVDELNKSTLSSYLDKTVDPVHGMPRSTDKLAQRMKGIARASKKVLAKEETAKVAERDGKKRAREAYISKKNKEEHRTHLGIHEAGMAPHSVELNVTHPHVDGKIYKHVKVTAKSVKQATDNVTQHYKNSGYKVGKVLSAQLHKVPAPLSPDEQAKEQEKENKAVEKKENSKISKIAKAIKDATK